MTDPRSPSPNAARPDEPASEATVRAVVDHVAQCEKRRLRRWAIATIALWIVTAGYVLSLVWFHLVFVHPALHEFLTNEEYRAKDLRTHGRVLISELTALMVWPVLLLIAGACTVAFIIASRRATLRQIQSSLAEISDQLSRGAGSS